jgi:hypothetical protein
MGAIREIVVDGAIPSGGEDRLVSDTEAAT